MPISVPPNPLPEVEDYSSIDKSRLLGAVVPDEPIYRFFPLWFFEEALRLRHLVLVSPQMWPDPFEILPERVMLQDLRTYKQTPFESFLRHAVHTRSAGPVQKNRTRYCEHTCGPRSS